MELIRCDQCKAEIERLDRHYTVHLLGMITFGSESQNIVHLCSESCGAAWFAKRAPTVEAASA